MAQKLNVIEKELGGNSVKLSFSRSTYVKESKVIPVLEEENHMKDNCKDKHGFLRFSLILRYSYFRTYLDCLCLWETILIQKVLVTANGNRTIT